MPWIEMFHISICLFYTSHSIIIPYIALSSVHTNIPSDNHLIVIASDNRFGLVDARNFVLDIYNKLSFMHSYHPWCFYPGPLCNQWC